MDILKFAVLMVVLHITVSSMIHDDLHPSPIHSVIYTPSDGGIPYRYS
jgi:hypothetical protein